jgi:F-type H+-transporting ATPase subunit epsilon
VAHSDTTALGLEISTPLGVALDTHVESVQVPSVAGEFGVLPGHVPLLAAVKPGVLKYKKDGASLMAAVGAGFAEVGSKHVRVIAEFFVRPEDVNAEEARKDLARAEERLKAPAALAGGTERTEAQREWDWARARLDVISS